MKEFLGIKQVLPAALALFLTVPTSHGLEHINAIADEHAAGQAVVQGLTPHRKTASPLHHGNRDVAVQDVNTASTTALQTINVFNVESEQYYEPVSTELVTPGVTAACGMKPTLTIKMQQLTDESNGGPKQTLAGDESTYHSLDEQVNSGHGDFGILAMPEDYEGCGGKHTTTISTHPTSTPRTTTSSKRITHVWIDPAIHTRSSTTSHVSSTSAECTYCKDQKMTTTTTTTASMTWTVSVPNKSVDTLSHSPSSKSHSSVVSSGGLTHSAHSSETVSAEASSSVHSPSSKPSSSAIEPIMKSSSNAASYSWASSTMQSSSNTHSHSWVSSTVQSPSNAPSHSRVSSSVQSPSHTPSSSAVSSIVQPSSNTSDYPSMYHTGSSIVQPSYAPQASSSIGSHIPHTSQPSISASMPNQVWSKHHGSCTINHSGHLICSKGPKTRPGKTSSSPSSVMYFTSVTSASDSASPTMTSTVTLGCEVTMGYGEVNPSCTVISSMPEITITQTSPEVTVTQTSPEITVTQTSPEVTVTQTTTDCAACADDEPTDTPETPVTYVAYNAAAKETEAHDTTVREMLGATMITTLAGRGAMVLRQETRTTSTSPPISETTGESFSSPTSLDTAPVSDGFGKVDDKDEDASASSTSSTTPPSSAAAATQAKEMFSSSTLLLVLLSICFVL